jgi:putative oxidoreductase
MHALSLPSLHRLSGLAPVVLRVIVGVVMAWHGWQKLSNGPENLADGLLTAEGVPAPLVVAWLMTIAELVGGIFLVVGFLTRLSTWPILVILIGAILLVKVDIGLLSGREGTGAELDLALIAGLIGVLLLGPGRPSLDHLLGIEKETPSLTPAMR